MYDIQACRIRKYPSVWSESLTWNKCFELGQKIKVAFLKGFGAKSPLFKPSLFRPWYQFIYNNKDS